MAKVDIANKALSYLGEETILSFDDENEQARAIKLHYDSCKRFLLTQHNWWFATKREALTEVTPHTDDKYPQAFQYPANCLKILRTDSDEEEWFRFEDQIWTTASAFTCEYIFEVAEANFSPGFEEALVYYLASKIALVVSGDRTVQRDAYNMFNAAIAQAIATNDLEQGVKSLDDDDGVFLRRGFYGLGLSPNEY